MGKYSRSSNFGGIRGVKETYVEKYRADKKLCSATRGSSNGRKEEGKQMYFSLVEKIETLRKDLVTGSDFEHKLMVKWFIEKKAADGEIYECGNL